MYICVYIYIICKKYIKETRANVLMSMEHVSKNPVVNNDIYILSLVLFDCYTNRNGNF